VPARHARSPAPARCGAPRIRHGSDEALSQAPGRRLDL
jgi:hypothetical protein